MTRRFEHCEEAWQILMVQRYVFYLKTRNVSSKFAAFFHGKMKRENEIAFFISLLRICNPQVLSSQLQSNKHLKYSLQIGFYLIGFKILILITNPA